MKPVVIDFFCGLGGWTRGFLAEGYDAFGFDIERHSYGDKHYPAQLVLQDVLTLHGRQFRDVAAIVASPPCQEFSYMAMPWTRAKQIAAALRGTGEFPEGYDGSRTLAELTALFDACFRLQREASEAAGRRIPLVVENVKGAQPWVGPAKAHYGSYYLWGDVESIGGRIVRAGVPVFGQTLRARTRVAKVTGLNWSGSDLPGYKAEAFNSTAVARLAAVKTVGHVNQRDGFDHTRHLTNQRESDGVKHGGDGVKQAGLSDPAWFNEGAAASSSKSDSRKAASAMIAEIPFDLAQWVAKVLKS